MNFFRKMERKYGKYAIHNLMYYIIILYLVGLLLNMINPEFYYRYLSLNVVAILHGQIWRLLTFLICPPAGSLLMVLISIYLYYSLGTALERTWGAFRFNVYFFMGVLGHILAAFLIYFTTGKVVLMSTYYLNQSLLLSFVATFPDMEFLLMFILPIKAKWLGIFIGAELLMGVLFGGTASRIEIIVSMLNFIIFFFMTRRGAASPKELHRRAAFKKEMQKAEVIRTGQPRHRCAVCGRTELDDPNLEFRYCSKCEGNLEYCMDHLYTHKHVTKEDLKEEKKG